MHEDKCKYAHTLPIEWEAASSKHNPGFDTSLGFQPGYQTMSAKKRAKSAVECYKRQGESSGGPDQKRSLLGKDFLHRIASIFVLPIVSG